MTIPSSGHFPRGQIYRIPSSEIARAPDRSLCDLTRWHRRTGDGLPSGGSRVVAGKAPCLAVNAILPLVQQAHVTGDVVDQKLLAEQPSAANLSEAVLIGAAHHRNEAGFRFTDDEVV